MFQPCSHQMKVSNGILNYNIMQQSNKQFSIRLKSLKNVGEISRSLFSDSKFEIYMVADSFASDEERKFCRQITSRYPIQLHHFDSWMNFKKIKLPVGILTILIVNNTYKYIAVNYVSCKPYIKLIIFTEDMISNVSEFYQNANITMITNRSKQLIKYIQNLLKQKDNQLKTRDLKTIPQPEEYFPDRRKLYSQSVELRKIRKTKNLKTDQSNNSKSNENSIQFESNKMYMKQQMNLKKYKSRNKKSHF